MITPGRRTVNSEPLPSSLVTVTSPPIMRCESARPSPVPLRPRRRKSDGCPARNRGCACGGQAGVRCLALSVANHPRCRVFSTLEAAIAALMAMQVGERAREVAERVD
jgi:hypothetical protein